MNIRHILCSGEVGGLGGTGIWDILSELKYFLVPTVKNLAQKIAIFYAQNQPPLSMVTLILATLHVKIDFL